MYAIRRLACVGLVGVLASRIAADEPSRRADQGWLTTALTSLTSGNAIADGEGRLEQAWRSDNAERHNWEPAGQDERAADAARERAARQALISANPAFNKGAAKQIAKPSVADPVASKPAKKPFGAVPGNPTGKRVHRKTRIDDGPIAPTVVRDPRT